ncbi:MAG TPA: hypothetical protein VIL68_07955 [Propionibacteriaceae bacterium]
MIRPAEAASCTLGRLASTDAWKTWLRTCRTDSCPDAASTDSNGVFLVRSAAFRCSATAINTLTVPFT